MQIHELNTFSGTPGASDYLATDDGHDTRKISATDFYAPLNARIDNIIAGPAPSAEEVIDARLGASDLGGITYSSLGGAIRGQVSELYKGIELLNDNLYKKSLFSWNTLGTTQYPTGFRMGQYKDDGTTGSSSYQCRLVNDLPYSRKTKKFVIVPPNGFSAKFTEFDSYGTFVRTVGQVAYHYSSGPVEIEVTQGYKYRVTVGWWTSAKTDADLTDALFADFPLTIYEEKNESAYDLYPTGDTTDRMREIYMILSRNHICRLAPGEYYFSRLRLPDNSVLIGADREQTRIVVDSSVVASTAEYVLKVGVNSRLANFTLEYITSSETTPSAQYENKLNGIHIRANGDDEIPYNIILENISVKNMPGCGLFMRNIGAGANGTSIRNFRSYHCSAGFYFGSHAEYNTIIGCYALQCYNGMIVMGGNNIISNCILTECEIGIALLKTDSYGTASNDAHGIINACKITHTGYWDNNGLAIKSEGQDYGEIISNCMMTTGIYVKDRDKALQFTGCQFRSGNNITIDNSKVLILNSVFYSGSDTGINVLNGGALYRTSCLDYDGNILENVL